MTSKAELGFAGEPTVPHEAAASVVPDEAAGSVVPDDRLLAAHDLALVALHEITAPGTVGEPAGYAVEPDGVVSLRFASAMAGYPGWFWTVSLARIDDAEPSVLEAELLPGETALLAPEWVPWTERLAEYHAQQAALAQTPSAEDAEDALDDAEGDEDQGDDVEGDGDDDLDAEDFDVDGSPILHSGDVDGVDIDELDPAAAEFDDAEFDDADD